MTGACTAHRASLPLAAFTRLSTVRTTRRPTLDTKSMPEKSRTSRGSDVAASFSSRAPNAWLVLPSSRPRAVTTITRPWVSSTNSIFAPLALLACRRPADRTAFARPVSRPFVSETLRHPMHQQQPPSADRTFFPACGQIEISLGAWVEHRPAIHHLGNDPIGQNRQADGYQGFDGAVGRYIGQ